MPGMFLISSRDGLPVADRLVEQAARSLDLGDTVRGEVRALQGDGWALLHGSGVGVARPGGGAGPAGRTTAVHGAVDGRIDNRPELLDALATERTGVGLIAPGADSRASDAELLVECYARWGEACFERFLGPFAAVLVDPGLQRVVCARDALGDRTVIYRSTPELFLAATDEELLLDQPGVSAAIDEGTVRRFFALEPPETGHTFFEDLREVPAGCCLTLDRAARSTARLRLTCHWAPDAGASEPARRDEEAAERFRAVLTESVRARLPDAGREGEPAVLMSGGLDSTAVAAVAARELEGGSPLRTFSWIFDELPRADEREFMEPTVEHLGAEPTWIQGDSLWPLGALRDAPYGMRRSPHAAIYRRLRDETYRRLHRLGIKTLLTGECGDQLFLGAEAWLRDLLAEGRIPTAVREAARSLGRSGRHDRVSLRATVGSLLGRTGRLPAWSLPAGVRRPRQAAALLDPRVAAAVRQEAACAARWGIEVRRPYRDRRLVEMALALPAHQLYRPGRVKWLGRQAVRGLLPESVRLRRRRSSLYPLFRRGLVEREEAAVRGLLDSPRAWWPQYVRPDRLRAFYPERVAAEVDGAEALSLWQCLALELWRRRLEGDDESHPLRIAGAGGAVGS